MIFQSYRDSIEHVEGNHPLNQQGGRQQIAPETLEDNRETDITENNTGSVHRQCYSICKCHAE